MPRHCYRTTPPTAALDGIMETGDRRDGSPAGAVHLRRGTLQGAASEQPDHEMDTSSTTPPDKAIFTAHPGQPDASVGYSPRADGCGSAGWHRGRPRQPRPRGYVRPSSSLAGAAKRLITSFQAAGRRTKPWKPPAGPSCGVCGRKRDRRDEGLPGPAADGRWAGPFHSEGRSLQGVDVRKAPVDAGGFAPTACSGRPGQALHQRLAKGAGCRHRGGRRELRLFPAGRGGAKRPIDQNRPIPLSCLAALRRDTPRRPAGQGSASMTILHPARPPRARPARELVSRAGWWPP